MAVACLCAGKAVSQLIAACFLVQGNCLRKWFPILLSLSFLHTELVVLGLDGSHARHVAVPRPKPDPQTVIL